MSISSPATRITTRPTSSTVLIGSNSSTIVPGWIIGSAGAHRYLLPKTAQKGAKEHIYGYVQGVVHPDGSIDFALHELSEDDLVRSKWPNAPLDAIHECYIHNADE